MKVSFLNFPTPKELSPKKAGMQRSLPFFMIEGQIK